MYSGEDAWRGWECPAHKEVPREAHLLTWQMRVSSGISTHHPPMSFDLTFSSVSRSISSRVSKSQNSYMKHWNALMNSYAEAQKSSCITNGATGHSALIQRSSL